MQFPDFLPDAHQPSNTALGGPVNLNVQINMALTNFVSNKEITESLNFLGQLQGSKPQLDMYRLWAKYFSPVGNSYRLGLLFHLYAAIPHSL
jgi:hypothetical protein